jgi:hypothetical protein
VAIRELALIEEFFETEIAAGDVENCGGTWRERELLPARPSMLASSGKIGGHLSVKMSIEADELAGSERHRDDVAIISQEKK